MRLGQWDFTSGNALERLRMATCRLRRLEEEEDISRRAIRAVPRALRAEIAMAEAQLLQLSVKTLTFYRE